ncbi:MAG: hypothetical protein VB027_03185 [Gordonibacter sp.]|nr:hypothetical protein [Gordonibacter sp.]
MHVKVHKKKPDAGDMLPKELLDDLGLEWVETDDVIFKPYSMSHAVVQ